MNLFFTMIVLAFLSSCAIKGGGKKSVDFKYWTVDHNVSFVTAPQPISGGSAQITSFQVTERRSVLGRDSWNVNNAIIVVNNQLQAFKENDVEESKLIENGIYEHYKGMTYLVHKIVRHSESLEEYVLYEALYENKLGKMWVRPLKMFFEKVQINGKELPRFRFLKKET